MKKNTKCCFGYCTYCIGRKGTQRRTLERGFLLDDGFSYDKDYKQFPCKCRGKNCVGYIVRSGSRWRINKKFKKKNISK